MVNGYPSRSIIILRAPLFLLLMCIHSNDERNSSRNLYKTLLDPAQQGALTIDGHRPLGSSGRPRIKKMEISYRDAPHPIGCGFPLESKSAGVKLSHSGSDAPTHRKSQKSNEKRHHPSCCCWPRTIRRARVQSVQPTGQLVATVYRRGAVSYFVTSGSHFRPRCVAAERFRAAVSSRTDQSTDHKMQTERIRPLGWLAAAAAVQRSSTNERHFLLFRIRSGGAIKFDFHLSFLSVPPEWVSLWLHWCLERYWNETDPSSLAPVIITGERKK